MSPPTRKQVCNHLLENVTICHIKPSSVCVYLVDTGKTVTFFQYVDTSPAYIFKQAAEGRSID